jgi:tRNA modification GTPase
MAESDTIYALSTAPVRAALAVIRVSGRQAHQALQKLSASAVPTPRRAALRRLSHPRDGRVLDEALVLCFAAPHSFTGEDMVELHVHGGLAVTQSVLEALAACDGLRMAEAGEFTRRAVLNGKMDLTAAEAIADLIDAEGSAQQAQALGQLQGGLRQQVGDWRERLKTMLAHLEADLEFADEDLPGGLGQNAVNALPDLAAEIETLLADRRGLVLRAGVQIALLGPPNAGKSSILNRLAGREAAIVSARAGTTRDVIEVAMTMDGVPVTLVDTAGLRAAGDEIEREGVRRAKLVAEEAHIRVLVTAPDVTQDEAVLASVRAQADLQIANKADLQGAARFENGTETATDTVVYSAVTGQGEAALLAALRALVAEKAGQGEGAGVTRLRHIEILQEVAVCLARAAAAPALELAAEDLRLAQRVLGRITGAVDVEQLLDVVFSDFCIGK